MIIAPAVDYSCSVRVCPKVFVARGNAQLMTMHIFMSRSNDDISLCSQAVWEERRYLLYPCMTLLVS